MTAKKLWIWLGATVAASFLVLIFYGVEIYRTTPPFPEKLLLQKGKCSIMDKTSKTVKMFGSQ